MQQEMGHIDRQSFISAIKEVTEEGAEASAPVAFVCSTIQGKLLQPGSQFWHFQYGKMREKVHSVLTLTDKDKKIKSNLITLFEEYNKWRTQADDILTQLEDEE